MSELSAEINPEWEKAEYQVWFVGLEPCPWQENASPPFKTFNISGVSVMQGISSGEENKPQ